MTETDRAYFAGVLDVAGKLDLCENKGKPCPIIDVRAQDRTMLDELATAFGGCVTVWHARGVASFRWKRMSRRAQAVAVAIQPYVRRRRLSVQRILAWTPGQAGNQPRERAKGWGL